MMQQAAGAYTLTGCRTCYTNFRLKRQSKCAILELQKGTTAHKVG